MFKKVLLLFCLALSFITFSCSEDNEPACGKLSQTMWEGKRDEYKSEEYVGYHQIVLTFANKNTMDYIIYYTSLQSKKTYNYSVNKNVIKIGDIDYYILEATKNHMVLQGFTDDYKHVLYLDKKK